MMGLADEMRAGSRQAMSELKACGIRPVLLSGGSPAEAGAFAKALGLEGALAGLSPEMKAATVREVGRERPVLAVGRRPRDAAFIREAAVGVALGAPEGPAAEAASVLLLNDDPRAVAALVRSVRRAGAADRPAAGAREAASALAVGVTLIGALTLTEAPAVLLGVGAALAGLLSAAAAARVPPPPPGLRA